MSRGATIQINPQIQTEIEEMAKKGRLCTKCLHLNVCAVYRAIAPLLNSFEGRKPFEAKELARICKEYTPLYTGCEV